MGIRRALLIALAVPALLLGLLGMHVLSGAGHGVGHGAPVGASVGDHSTAHDVGVAAGQDHAGAPGAEASAFGALGDGDAAGAAAALACVLALLATLLLAAATDPVRLPKIRAVARRGPRIAPMAPRELAPSLVELSISRT